MEIYPAVDLMEGACVRLVKGKETSKKVYYRDPLEAALRFEKEGAVKLHVVDLDAAMGFGDNTGEISKIVRGVNVKVQVAGGIRTIDKVLKLVALGAFRVVLGTAAIEDPSFLRDVVSAIGSEKVALALDLIGDRVMVEGWKKEGSKDPNILIEEANRLSLGALIFTSIRADGTLGGADLEAARLLRREVKIPMIVAGGVKNLEDLEELSSVGVEGVIIGKALYERTINLQEAISKLSTL